MVLALALLLLQGQEPYKKPPESPLEFRGPGRDEPEPEVSEVALAWFGPGDPDHPELGDFWRGAVLGLEAENAAGGWRDRPFRLEAVWSESPWKAGITDLTRLVVEGDALAVIGGLDGASTHLALQTALKGHVVLLSPGSTDATTDHANVPWLFSLAPSDEAIAAALAEAAVRAETDGTALAVAAATDHDSHAALAELRRSLARRNVSPAALVELAGDEPDPAGAIAQLLRARPRELAVIAPPRLGARVVEAARRAGFAGVVLGGPALGRAAFARAAGRWAEGVVAPRLVVPVRDEAFVAAYDRQWGEEPDAAASLGYDAVRIVAAAIRRAGLNRARIGDEVRALAPWSGATGTVRWDALGRNDAGCTLGCWRGGRLVPLD